MMWLVCLVSDELEQYIFMKCKVLPLSDVTGADNLCDLFTLLLLLLVFVHLA